MIARSRPVGLYPVSNAALEARIATLEIRIDDIANTARETALFAAMVSTRNDRLEAIVLQLLHVPIISYSGVMTDRLESE